MNTIQKIVFSSGTGLGISFSNVESSLRITSLIVSIGLTLYVFIRDELKKKKQNKED